MNVAVVGATGLVGQEVLELFGERRFPFTSLVLAASERSVGMPVECRGEELEVRDAADGLDEDLDLAILCVPAAVARDLAPGLVDRGATVVDVSSAFRTDAAVPLLLAEAGADEAAAAAHGGLLALPDPLARMAAVPVRTLANLAGVRRVGVVAHVGAASSGRERVEALARASSTMLGGESPEEGSPAFTIDVDDARATSLEAEIARLTGLDVPVTVRALVAPIFFGAGLGLSVELDADVDRAAVVAALRETPSLVLGDEAIASTRDAVGTDFLSVARLDVRERDPRHVDAWIVADNVRQGTALHAVSIGEIVLRHRGAH